MKKQNLMKRSYLCRFGAFCMALMLTFTGVGTGMTATVVKADTSQEADRSVTWYGYNFDGAHVDSVSYLHNINMHSGSGGIDLSDSCYSYGPLQSTRRYAYIKFDFTDGDSSERNIMEELKGATVNYAYLRLVERSNSDIPGTVIIKSPMQDWNPSTLTYANQPQLWDKVWARCACTGIKNRANYFDLTEWAKNVANGTIQDYGFALMEESKKTVNMFYGANQGGYSAQLCISYKVNE